MVFPENKTKQLPLLPFPLAVAGYSGEDEDTGHCTQGDENYADQRISCRKREQTAFHVSHSQ
uniref:Uncharacterized protein n=1 Tax=Anguilla anguilla TaxID=7936 RepID=A0A0E9QHN1_ANGAN